MLDEIRMTLALGIVAGTLGTITWLVAVAYDLKSRRTPSRPSDRN